MRPIDQDGILKTVVTFLEMTKRPTTPTPPRPALPIALMRADNPTTAFYWFLYDSVGEPWLWFERRLLSDDDLRQIIEDKRVELYVFYIGGVPAGYSELDCRTPGEVEIAYFGLMPEFIGRGCGRYFLRWTIDQAWIREPDRVWVHTCDLDHPRALRTYQKAGFEPYRQEPEEFADPRLNGIFGNWSDPRPPIGNGEKA